MNWKYKAILQQVFSHIPCRERLNYFSQRYLTKSLPLGDNLFIEKIKEAKRHYDVLLKFSDNKGVPLQEVKCYEFGAGWDFVIAFSYYFMGINSQIIVDILPLFKVELINDTLQRIKKNHKQFKSFFSRDIEENSIPLLKDKNLLVQLREHYGIVYKAPTDASNTHLASDSVDFISSTNTFEHVPEQEILSIFEECYRIMKKGGVMSCRIDYQDHYTYFDDTISVYNFLKYSDLTWKLFNPSLQLQNRLRHKDYIEIIKKTKFEYIENKVYEPTANDIKSIKYLKLDDKFKQYSLDELAVRWSYIILKK